MVRLSGELALPSVRNSGGSADPGIRSITGILSGFGPNDDQGPLLLHGKWLAQLSYYEVNKVFATL